MDTALDTQRRSASAPGGASAPNVARMAAAGLETSLERFNDPVLLAEGKVNVIALDAVVQRFGTRWPMRRDQVYDHVDRTLQRQLGVGGYYARVSETDFLIAQPDLSRFAGQACCLRYLREILGHFLGEAHLANDGVHEVTRVSADGVEARKVNARQVEEAEELEISERRSANDGARRSLDQWSPFTASDGRSIRVSCVLEPVYELKNYSRIGFRLARRVLLTETEEALAPADIANLARVDIIRIDMATIVRGLERLASQNGGERQPSVIIPVSYTSLSSQRGRAEIVGAFKDARALVKRGVICELCDIEGVPQGALLSAVSLIRPFSLFIVGRLGSGAPPSVAALKGAGLQAIAFECPPHQDEAEFEDWATQRINAAKRVVRSVLLYGANSAGTAGVAALLGATHASVRSL